MSTTTLTFEQYLAEKGVSWSRLKLLRQSPKKFRHAWDHKEDSDAGFLRIGQVTHTYLLEPEKFAERFVVWTGKVRNGKAWESFKTLHAERGQIIVSPREMEEGVGAAKGILAHPVAAELLKVGLCEANISWTDRATGLKCRARVDHTGRNVTELKTAAQLAPRQFSSAACRLGYHAQLAFYADGLRENGIAVDPEPKVICVESKPPHDVIVYRFPTFVVDEGRDMYRRLLEKLGDCLKRNTWPGRAPEIVAFDLPMWALDDDEDGPIANLKPAGEGAAPVHDDDPDWMKELD